MNVLFFGESLFGGFAVSDRSKSFLTSSIVLSYERESSERITDAPGKIRDCSFPAAASGKLSFLLPFNVTEY